MSRKKIVAGNWKMNLTPQEGAELVNALLAKQFVLDAQTEVVIAPSYVHLIATADLLKDAQQFHLAAQNCHEKEAGAYTGEVSAKMVKSIGAKYVIIGHSERREYNDETDALLADKVNAALAQGLEVIFCCGEPLAIREADTQNDYINIQIKNSLFHLDADAMSKIVIAYEPIWAIGTGKTASAEQAQDMHANIRAFVASQYGQDTANNTSILYGGSCNPKNAAELFGQQDIDGGLIGGASLKADDFAAVIAAI